MKKLIRFLLQGLLNIAPIGITIYILHVNFVFVDGLLIGYLERLIGIHISVLGLIIIIVLLITTGFLGQTFIDRPIKALFDKLQDKIPILRVIFTAFNDLFSAFVGKEKKIDKPVLVLVDKSLGFGKPGLIYCMK